MNWIPVVAAIVLTTVTVGLVQYGGWNPYIAGVLVVAGGAILLLALTGTVCLFLRPAEREAFWNSMLSTAKADWGHIVRALTFRQ